MAVHGSGPTSGKTLIQNSLLYQCGYVSGMPEAWQRPTDWPALDDFVDGQQKIQALIAVYPGTSTTIMSVTITGAYTVDWGDGTTQNFASGAQATYTYDYTNVNLGAVTTEGFKTAKMTITPQAGQNITAVQLFPRFPGAVQNTASPVIEIYMNAPNMTSFSNGEGANKANPGKVRNIVWFKPTAIGDYFRDMYQLQRLTFLNPITSSSTKIFDNCYSLAELNGSMTLSTGQEQFRRCYNLNEFPPGLQLTAANASTLWMFGYCSIQDIPNIPGFKALNGVTNNMLRDNYTLTQIPDNWDFSAMTGPGAFFLNCYALRRFTQTNLTAATDATSMFQNCQNLQSVNDLTTPNLTVSAGMFQGCRSLLRAPNMSLTKVTNMDSMYNGCLRITSVPTYDTANATSMNSTFAGCSSLVTAPDFNTNKVTNMTNMFQNCVSLTRIPSYNCANVTTGLTNMLSGAVSVAEINLSNIKVSFNFPGAALTSNAANAVLANLQSVSTAQTIGMTLNPGIDALVSKTSVSSTAGSTTITLANTVGLSNGMVITGANVNSARTCVANVDTVTLTAHGLINNTMVSFNNANVTGTANQPVYVANAATDTFQVSLAPGGSAITFVANSSPNVQYGRYIANIVANTSITMTTPAGATGTGTITFRNYDTTLATLKGWTVSG